MKVFVLLTLVCLAFSALAVDTVRIYDYANLAVDATSGTTFALNVEAPAGDGTAETSPAKIYIPMIDTIVGNTPYFYYSRSGGAPLSSTQTSSVIHFPLVLKVGSTAKNIYTAVKVNSNYYVVAKSSTNYSDVSDTRVTLNLAPSLFCDTFPLAGATNPCSETSTFATTMMTYFFVSSNTYATGEQITIANESGGVYFDLRLSNRVYQSSAMTITLSNIRKGDKRILFDYTSSATMINFSKVKAFIHSSLPLSDNYPLGDTGNYSGSIALKDYGTSQSGEVVINELTNGANYDVSLFFIDKYNFASVLSPYVSAQPTEIQELLKKQACYLLTAGFGEEHYIVNYFREYRDQVLAKNWLGQKFIGVYYSTAPKAALFIYKHEMIRSGIRLISYVLYFFLREAWMLLIFSVSTICLLNLRKNKVLFHSFRL